MFTSILVIIITGFVIYFSGNKFATVSSEIGDYYGLSRSVKGATLDAVKLFSRAYDRCFFCYIF